VSGAILLTGATGFLGMETLARLIDRGEEQIIVLVRAEDADAAGRRLAEIMACLYDGPTHAALSRVRAARGDLLAPRLGMSEEDRQSVVGSVDRIIHCAASISFDMPLRKARAINVAGVARMIELALETAACGALRRVVHVSTAYVSGCHRGWFRENDLDAGQEFRNTYERSKHEAEQLLREHEELPITTARPSIVVGNRVSGWTPAFNVIYWPMRAAERGLLRELPAHPESVVDYVPVDYVADGIIALLEDPASSGTYNLVAGPRALTAGELVELHASLVDAPPVRLIEREMAGALPEGAEAYLPYFDVQGGFDNSRARTVLERAGVEEPDPTAYLGRLIDYAHATRWGKRPMSREAAMRRICDPDAVLR
jgi:thioester reductase-like protein